MERELKIVIGLVMTFFLFGLGSFFNFGEFVTPFFLNAPLIVVTSATFFAMNRKIPRAYTLLFFTIGYLALCITDENFTDYLRQTFEFVIFNSHSEAFWISILGDVLFFGAIIASVYGLHVENKNWPLSVILTSLLTAVIGLMFFDFFVVQKILMLLFFLTYFVVCHRIKLSTQSISLIVSDVYFLIVSLESFKFFL
jgi:uncharacterized membrane protein